MPIYMKNFGVSRNLVGLLYFKRKTLSNLQTKTYTLSEIITYLKPIKEVEHFKFPLI